MLSLIFQRLALCRAKVVRWTTSRRVGEPIAVMPSEVPKDRLVSVHAEELSDELDGENLRVGKLGSRTALANTAALEPVVDEAEDGNDEGAKIQERRPPLRRLVWSLPSVRRYSLWLKSSKKLAQGVS